MGRARARSLREALCFYGSGTEALAAVRAPAAGPLLPGGGGPGSVLRTTRSAVGIAKPRTPRSQFEIVIFSVRQT